jgi:hypothetical protein
MPPSGEQQLCGGAKTRINHLSALLAAWATCIKSSRIVSKFFPTKSISKTNLDKFVKPTTKFKAAGKLS